ERQRLRQGSATAAPAHAPALNGARETPNLQLPTTNQLPTANHQFPNRVGSACAFGSWALGVPWQLVLGSWELTRSVKSAAPLGTRLRRRALQDDRRQPEQRDDREAERGPQQRPAFEAGE